MSFLRGNLGTLGALGGAAFLGLALGLMHLLGWRDSTSLLSGTAPGADGSLVEGLLYVAGWFLFVLCGPILVLSAVFYRLLDRLLGKSSAGDTPA